MNQTASAEKIQVEIPFSFVEYTAVFRKPIFAGMALPGKLVASVLDALQPFGFNLDGVEAKTRSEKVSDVALVFRRQFPPVTVTLGLGKLTIVAENIDWAAAEQFMRLAEAGMGAVVEEAKAEIQAQHLMLAMHVQLKSRPRLEVAMRLLSPLALQLMDGEIMITGMSISREKASILVDGSVSYANALFVRFVREYGADVSFAQMSERVLADERQLFDALGFEGDL